MTSGQGAREPRRDDFFFLSLKDLVPMKSDLGEIRFQSVHNWSRCASVTSSARVAELGVLGQDDGLNVGSTVGKHC